MEAVAGGVRGGGVRRPGDGLAERLRSVGSAGRVGDPGEVAVPAAGHGDVDAGSGGGGFDDGDAGVDGDALIAVAVVAQPSSTWRAT